MNILPRTTLLGHLLLGLVFQRAQSGYALRKLFTSTPLGSYSDSPGAIYPALRRLEQQGLLEGHPEKTGLRERRVYRITDAGMTTLQRWLELPIQRADVVRGQEELMARFAFMDEVIGAPEALAFLQALERELETYSRELAAFLRIEGPTMSRSGRLAMDSGVRSYIALLGWARAAIDAYKTPQGGTP